MGIENTITGKYKWILWVKVLTLIVCCWLIYEKISDPQRFGREFVDLVSGALDAKSIMVLLGVLLLMPANWLLESLKWKVLVRPHSQISISEAYKGVLSGLSLGFATPHGIGDYAGRLLSIEGESRSQLLGSIWLGRVMQMTVTGIFGTVGVWVFLQKSTFQLPTINHWWWIMIGIVVVFILLLYQSKLKFFGRRTRYYFNFVSTYSWLEYISVFALSFGRYAIFSIQFLLILNIFNIPLPVSVLFAGISWMFLMKSIVPSFNFLSDLGVRELSVLTFFDMYGASQPAVLTSSLLLWTINILLPVLVGLYFVLKLKIVNSR
jgi:uncharacterized membrane protein YbhN (UPF0104 family)